MPNSPPRAPPVKYATPLGTRWEKEKAAAGSGAFDYPGDAKYVGPWIIGECVGKGASGRVKIARHRRTGQLAAIKILPLQPFVNSRASLATQAKTEKQRLGVDREITMMKLMNHPNIMRIYDVYEGDKELYLILEYVEGGELFDFLVNRGRLPPLEALAYFKQIVYGLNYAHTFSIIHRDLKPENILIHSLNPPLIKIADWGMAAFAPPSLQLETSCGSPHYASPEIVNGHKYSGTATDIWSCGVILYALLTGRLPFDDKNVRTLLTKVKIGKYDMPSFVDPLAKDLLSRMLVVDVAKRITMAEVLAHPWLESLTPGITYVSAPPVSELAKPLPSALHIDRDLFESLCVIWGRHADSEVIKADLLSAAGKGTLAKAFYFLLQKHREKAMEEHGILMDIDEVLSAEGKVVTKQYAAPRAKKVGHLEVQDLNRPQSSLPLRSNRAAPGASSRTPSPNGLVVYTDVLMERTPSRPYPPSPIGPRPQKPRPVTGNTRGSHAISMPPSFAPNPDAIWLRQNREAAAASQVSQSMFAAPGIVPPPMQRAAASAPGASRPTVSPPVVSIAAPLLRRNSTTVSAPGIIHAPVPLAARPTLPMIAAPRVPDEELQKAIDHYATVVNIQAATWNAAQGQCAHGHMQGRMNAREESQDVASGIIQRMETENKENWHGNGRARRHTHIEHAHDSGGLGFGHSVPMAKEMGNMLFINDSGGREQTKDRKKSRPPPLDLHGVPILQKRATFSVNSSAPMSPGVSVGSPVVGEFKGWFSNLFHWKVQSYLLYSAHDLPTTRTEVTRLLEQFGVHTVLEENFGWSVLKCRVDDIHDGSALIQKQVRFRVEFSGAPSSHAYSQPGATPRLSQNPMSPHVISFPGARSRVDMSGYETILGFVLEKGAVSTFKVIYHRLRGEWRLDALQSPRAAVGATPSIEQRFMV
ncbi:Serine/threonine-protein kinase HSL1 [Grifola frondosa]|uniref:Serine/threonine-protein kinase HSL1 n=1 Tax=Grifola frondosa TaxID=5627 RepID=A0A1C7LSX1_GRIFR|nr:Serine/threonine-protein kinase HSL1 [Grifola frondosa]